VVQLVGDDGVAVVQEHIEPRGVEDGSRLLADLLGPLDDDDMNVVRRDRRGPDDAVLVVVLLDNGRQRPREADACSP
jgi:hypothetical protein